MCVVVYVAVSHLHEGEEESPGTSVFLSPPPLSTSLLSTPRVDLLIPPDSGRGGKEREKEPISNANARLNGSLFWNKGKEELSSSSSTDPENHVQGNWQTVLSLSSLASPPPISRHLQPVNVGGNGRGK